MPPRFFTSKLTWSCVAVLMVAAAVGLSFVLPVAAQAPHDNALPFTRSYLLTGNYAVAGVDLPPQASDCTTFAPGCYAKGAIQVAACPASGAPPAGCIPAGADVVAAWMYWEALSTDPELVPMAKLRPGGTSAYSTVVKARRNDEALPNQGSCLSSSGTPLTLSMFSADVLRFFPFERDANNVSTGRRQVVGTHDIALAEVGTGNNARQGAGATLFFVYRLPSEPLRKVVVYDGSYLQPIDGITRQQIQGVYQSAADKSGWLTNVIGSGAKNTNERLFFNDVLQPAVDMVPFPLGSEGGSGSDRAWTNPTVPVSLNQSTTNATFGETAWMSVDHSNSSPYECLSWAAVIFSTAVKDDDADGLPDGLESAQNGLKDPDPADLLKTVNVAGLPLPNLYAMGARVGERDVFIEMNGMWAPPKTVYGDNENTPSEAPFSTLLNIPFVTTTARHDHLPTPEVIKLMGESLEKAPQPIRLHVDVGNLADYQNLVGSWTVADKYLVCDRGQGTTCIGSSPHARGGEIIEEVYCDDGQQTIDPTQLNSLGCHFPYFPGTVGWKFGLQHYRDAAVDADTGEELTADEENLCYSTGFSNNAMTNACRRRFDPNRAGLFHYFLYAHALGIPKGKPCLENGLDADYNGVDSNNKGVCVGARTPNPNFNVPRSTSGAADAPGGNALITLGLWDRENHVGSPFLVASTSVHELGHNWDLSHGGKPPVFGNASTATKFEPNCKPNYPSIMSYLFQVNGLLHLDGTARIDFSRGVYGDLGNADTSALNEVDLNDKLLLLPDANLNAAFQYKTAWFVPVSGSLATALGVQPANRFCNGVKFEGSATMGRFDGPGLSSTPTTSSLIDWDLNDLTHDATQDVNFDGPNGATSYQGYNDWANVRLNQIGGGKNPGGFSLGQGGFEFGQGGFEFGQGGFEFGQGGFDYGQGGFEFGQGGFEFGQGGFEFGQGGFDYGDGAFNFGQGGFEFGQGGFDYGQGGFDYGNDVDYEQIARNGHSPAKEAAATVIQALGTANHHRHRVTWVPPHVGLVTRYKVYRFRGTSLGDGSGVELVCTMTTSTTLPSCPTGTTFVDTEELPFNQTFTYFIRAIFDKCESTIAACESGPSNFAPVDTQNVAPVAANDPAATQNFTTEVEVPLTIAAPGVLFNDTDEDSLESRIRVVPSTIVAPLHGTLVLNENGSFVYTPEPKYTGTDTFKYKADDGFWRTSGILMSPESNEVTVTITITNKGGGGGGPRK